MLTLPPRNDRKIVAACPGVSAPLQPPGVGDSAAEVFESDSVEQTEAVAAELAQTLSAGACVALHGDLGAGKTQFVRGLVRGVGGNARAVSSPTFVLLNVYDDPGIRLTVYHLDAYRVTGVDEFESIGFTELLEQGGVVVVEWAERVAPLIPANHINVTIQPVGEGDRRIEVNRNRA